MINSSENNSRFIKQVFTEPTNYPKNPSTLTLGADFYTINLADEEMENEDISEITDSTEAGF